MRSALLLAALAACTPARPKSPTLAKALSAGGAGASYGVVLASFLVDPGYVNKPMLFAGLGTAVVTPSLGQIYAQDYLTLGMGVRLAAGLLAVGGTSLAEKTRCLTTNDPEARCETITGNGIAVLGLAGVIAIGGAAYDVLDAAPAVARYNLHVTPLPHGVALAGHF